MIESIHSSAPTLTVDQFNELQFGLMRLSARMSPEQIGDLADALHNLRRVRRQHAAFRQFTRERREFTEMLTGRGETIVSVADFAGVRD